MTNCAEKKFNQDLQSLSELLARVQTVELSDKFQRQLSDNRVLFKKLKAILKQDYSMLLFLNNEVIILFY